MLALHIGLGKTGTTAFQRSSVSANPQYLGLSGLSTQGDKLTHELYLIFQQFCRQQLSPEDVSAWWIKVRKHQSEVSQPIIISSEYLTGPTENLSILPSLIFKRDYLLNDLFCDPQAQMSGGTERYFNSVRFIDLLLNSINTEIKVILGVRDQASYFASIYSQWSDRNRFAGQDDFEATAKAFCLSGDLYLNYELWIEQLADVLGGRNLLVAPMESIAQLNYWEDISDFLEFAVSPNGMSNARSVAQRRWRLRVNRRRIWRCRGQKEIVLTDSLSEWFAYRFNKSLKKFEEVLEINEVKRAG